MKFAATMPSDATHAAIAPRPSIFISYSSADRASVRTLRDTLEAAGLDVWLDEDELGGGEAWDAKIRNQIRACTYFMPVISASTEVRREGYFRREWRLAVERTLDLADDVMFLVPIVIDDTHEAGARVPEKFFSVQWLRVPDGVATTGLRELAAKLAAGETAARRPPAPAAPSVFRRSDRKDREPDRAPPPFPHFPPYPERGQFFRFAYGLLLWGGRMLHAFWGHLPRFVRIIASIVIVFNVITWIRIDHSGPSNPVEDKVAKLSNLAENGSQTVPAPGSAGKPSAAAVIESLVGAAADAAQAGRPLAVVTFSGQGEDGAAYAEQVFDDTCELLQQEGKDRVSISPVPLADNFTDIDALLRGARLKSQFVLTGRARREVPDQPLKLTVKLYSVRENKLVWTETYDSAQVDAPTAGQRIAGEVKQRVALAAQPQG